MIIHAKDELIYGLQIGKPVTLGVETKCINRGKITFCEEGETALDNRLSKVKSFFQDNRGFNGFAIHHYRPIKYCPIDKQGRNG